MRKLTENHTEILLTAVKMYGFIITIISFDSTTKAGWRNNRNKL